MSRRRFTLILIVVTSISILTLDFRGFGPLESARSTVLGVLAPVGDFFGAVFEPVGNVWNGITGYGALEDENARLRQEIDDLAGQMAASRTARDELEQLKRSLDIPFASDIESVAASVTSGSISNYDARIEIDKGASSGVEKDMAVVTGAGLVGRVVVVSENRAVVQLVTQSDQQFAVKLPDKDNVGIARGQGDGRFLLAEFPFESQIRDDDIIVTLGGRSVFPPDIPVGRVASVTENRGELREDLEIDLFANLNDLKYVSVLLWTPPD